MWGTSKVRSCRRSGGSSREHTGTPIWFKSLTKSTKHPDAKGPASKRYDLDMRVVSEINSALSDKTDLKAAEILKCNTKPKRTFQGVTPGHKDFVLDINGRKALLLKEPSASAILFPYFVGKEVLGGATGTTRCILDFGEMNLLAAQSFPRTMEYVQQNILPRRMKEAEEGSGGNEEQRAHHKLFLKRWWQLSFRRTDMLNAISGLHRYLACSRVTSRPIFFFIAGHIRPGDALQVFAFDDDYSFGVLQSRFHVDWFMSKRSNMKSDARYSSTGVFGTFPWPQNPPAEKVLRVAEAARSLQHVRDSALLTTTGGLRALEDTLKLPGQNPLKDAHLRLDEAVQEAFGFVSTKPAILQLMELNTAVAAKI